jgi:hypothetical protein
MKNKFQPKILPSVLAQWYGHMFTLGVLSIVGVQIPDEFYIA